MAYSIIQLKFKFKFNVKYLSCDRTALCRSLLLLVVHVDVIYWNELSGTAQQVGAILGFVFIESFH